MWIRFYENLIFNFTKKEVFNFCSIEITDFFFILDFYRSFAACSFPSQLAHFYSSVLEHNYLKYEWIFFNNDVNFENVIDNKY